MLTPDKGKNPHYELKHRLAGAVILVTVAVLVVPFLLTDPDPGEGAGLSGSEPGELADGTRVTSEVSDGSRTSTDVKGGDDLPLKSVDEQELAKLDLTKKNDNKTPESVSSSKVVPDATDSVTPDPNRKTPRPALVMTKTGQTTTSAGQETGEKPQAASMESSGASNEKEWIVGVAAYEKQSNVEVVTDLLKDKGYDPRTKIVQTNGKNLTRIFLGPYADRNEAESVRRRMSDLTGKDDAYVTNEY